MARTRRAELRVYCYDFFGFLCRAIAGLRSALARALPRAMSIKLTTQMDWMHYSSYSKYHPDNLARSADLKLPDPILGPPPVAEITAQDKQVTGAWGHALCCERAYGPCETTTRIKGMPA